MSSDRRVTTALFYASCLLIYGVIHISFTATSLSALRHSQVDLTDATAQAHQPDPVSAPPSSEFKQTESLGNLSASDAELLNQLDEALELFSNSVDELLKIMQNFGTELQQRLDAIAESARKLQQDSAIVELILSVCLIASCLAFICGILWKRAFCLLPLVALLSGDLLWSLFTFVCGVSSLPRIATYVTADAFVPAYSLVALFDRNHGIIIATAAAVCILLFKFVVANAMWRCYGHLCADKKHSKQSKRVKECDDEKNEMAPWPFQFRESVKVPKTFIV